MKKTLLILGSIGVLCMLLAARLLFVQRSSMGEEREWFVKALRYEFSARVDSVRMLNENTGRLWCRVTWGNPQSHREDSLKPFFKKHDMLYLIFRQSGDSILFLIPEKGKQIIKGDSVRISSKENSIRFFRKGKPVTTNPLTNTLTGFGRPFFLKKK
jgi:hypothetical protein